MFGAAWVGGAGEVVVDCAGNACTTSVAGVSSMFTLSSSCSFQLKLVLILDSHHTSCGSLVGLFGPFELLSQFLCISNCRSLYSTVSLSRIESWQRYIHSSFNSCGHILGKSCKRFIEIRGA